MKPRRRLGWRRRLGLRLFADLYQKRVAAHRLNTLFWECTLRCNLACRHCGSDCRTAPASPDMPLEDFLRVLDEEVTPHTDPGQVLIIFSGGEVLVRQDLELAGRSVTQRGYPWGMVTNGMALTPERLSNLREAGLRSIAISFDGFEAEHNYIRQNPLSWERALAAIRSVLSLREVPVGQGVVAENFASRTGIDSGALKVMPPMAFDIVTCVTSPMVGRLEEFKEFLIAEGVKHWRIFTIFPAGRAATDKSLTISDSEFRKVLDFIEQTRREGRIDLSYACEGYLGGYEGRVRDHFYQCAAGVSIASVRVDGDISGCTSIRAPYAQGNIYKDRFWEVWSSGFQTFRDRAWTRKPYSACDTGAAAPENPCARCKQWKFCLGGGMHLRDNDGRLMYCHYKRL